MSNSIPRVSIGMPVYNGERSVGAALDSLLSQTFGDFELIISDNASTDGTPEVLARYAAEDARVRVIRQAQNIGANPNYSEVARRARGELFKWASSNDCCAPTFLERCVSALQASPDAVLAFPRTKVFTHTLADAQEYPDDFAVESDRPAERFMRVAATLRLNNIMNGLIRMSSLRRTRLVSPHYMSDVVLMAQLALFGKFVQVPEFLFFRRMDATSATRLKTWEEVQKHHYPRREMRTLFPSWRLCADWFRVVASAPVPLSDKRKAFSFVARMCYYSVPDLLRDFREAARYYGARGTTL